MDQVRKILSWLKAQHFWVLSGLIALVGIFCWWSAAGTYSRKYEENQKKITTEFQNLQQVRSGSFHPNEEINKRQVAETAQLSEAVADLWEKLYEAQRENVLKWPPQLNQAFRDAVEKLEFGQNIPSNLRETYQNYILRHFPELPEKIGAAPITEGMTMMGGGGEFSRRGGPEGMGVGTTGPMMADDNYICNWEPASQAEVRADLEFPQQPSSIRIWVTQENLWVYHTLLDVIKNTNQAAGATRTSNAAVRNIYMLDVGKRAAPFSRTPNRIYKPPTAAAATLDGGEFGGEFPAGPESGGEFPGDRGGEFGYSPGGSEFGGTGPMSEAEEAAFLLSGRYLGEDGKPILAGGAGGDPSMSMDETAPAAPATIDLSAYGKEYKRLPIRMVLQMDQRHLPRLIAECAVRPLQIEVQEVRINPPSGIEGGTGMSSMMGGDFGGSSLGGGGSFRGEFGGAGAGSLFGETSGLQPFNPQPQIANVIIQGVIYIFKKPDPAVLQATSDGAEALTDAVQ